MSEDIFYIVFPIHQAGRFMGMIPFPILSAVKLRSADICISYDIITYTFQIVIAGLFVWCTINVALEYYGLTSILVFLAYMASTTFNYLFYLADTINKVVYRNEIVNIFARLYQQDKEMNKLGLKLPYSALRRRSLFYFMFHITAVLQNLAICWWYALKNKITLQLIYAAILTYISLSQAISISIYFGMILTITNMFQNITSSLLKNFVYSKRVTTLSDYNDVQLLKKLVACYQNLTDVLRKFNRTISSQILFLMGMYFSNVTVQLLILVQVGMYLRNILTVILGMCFLIFKEILRLWLLLQATDSCQKQENCLKKTLYRIVIHNRSAEIRNKVRAFSSQLLHDKVEITAAGFFHLDLTVLVSILSAVVTYCSILYQSNPSMPYM